MLMTKDRRPAIRTLRGWAISVLLEPAPSASARSTAGCKTVPIRSARQEPPCGFSPEQAVAEVRNMLESVGDTCPECPRA
jgi:hypothetical protein